MADLKQALLERMDGILQGLGVLAVIGMVLVAALLHSSFQRDRCVEALKNSRNGALIVGICR